MFSKFGQLPKHFPFLTSRMPSEMKFAGGAEIVGFVAELTGYLALRHDRSICLVNQVVCKREQREFIVREADIVGLTLMSTRYS